MSTAHVTRLALALALASGCASQKHIDEYTPKERDYEIPVQVEKTEQTRREGSLWSRRDQVNYLYTDQRALRVGDILTVRVEEFANATRGTNTSKKRLSQMNADISEFLGLMTKLQEVDPDINPQSLVDASSDLDFDVEGRTGRSEQLQATVPVMVKKLLPNGNLFVEGHRVILVNEEEHHFYVSGVARPIDIDETNSVRSSRLADAEIEFTGRGVLSEGNRPGPLARALQWIWPF